MYSVGMSKSAVDNIADAIGKLAAGKVESITGGSVGNLVVMAANEAGLSIADMLAKGLDAETTNQLLEAMVTYLSKLYAESKDSKVVQQQIASVYGLTASDLKSITNLLTEESAARGQTSETMKAIAGLQASYSDMYGQFESMANSMYKRTSIGEMMTNAWQNVQYTMAASIANNPALYAIYKVAGLLDTAVGGIAIPAISIMGNMVDLHTSVADLMRVAAMSGGILSGIGQMIKAGGGGGITGSGMIKALNISGNATVARGTKSGLKTSGKYTSESGSTTVGNEDGGSVKDKTMADASNDQKKQLAEGQADEDADISRKVLRDALLSTMKPISETEVEILNEIKRIKVIPQEDIQQILTAVKSVQATAGLINGTVSSSSDSLYDIILNSTNVLTTAMLGGFGEVVRVTSLINPAATLAAFDTATSEAITRGINGYASAANEALAGLTRTIKSNLPKADDTKDTTSTTTPIVSLGAIDTVTVMAELSFGEIKPITVPGVLDFSEAASPTIQPVTIPASYSLADFTPEPITLTADSVNTDAIGNITLPAILQPNINDEAIAIPRLAADLQINTPELVSIPAEYKIGALTVEAVKIPASYEIQKLKPETVKLVANEVDTSAIKQLTLSAIIEPTLTDITVPTLTADLQVNAPETIKVDTQTNLESLSAPELTTQVSVETPDLVQIPTEYILNDIIAAPVEIPATYAVGDLTVDAVSIPATYDIQTPTIETVKLIANEVDTSALGLITLPATILPTFDDIVVPTTVSMPVNLEYSMPVLTAKVTAEVDSTSLVAMQVPYADMLNELHFADLHRTNEADLLRYLLTEISENISANTRILTNGLEVNNAPVLNADIADLVTKTTVENVISTIHEASNLRLSQQAVILAQAQEMKAALHTHESELAMTAGGTISALKQVNDTLLSTYQESHITATSDQIKPKVDLNTININIQGILTLLSKVTDGELAFNVKTTNTGALSG